MRFTFVIAMIFLFGTANPDGANTKQATTYDVVVIGGTPAGIAAALAAGRAGKTVMLVEQAPVLGGVLSSGVNRLDDERMQANSGVMEEFRERVGEYHRTKLANDPVVKQHLANPLGRNNMGRWVTIEGQAWEPKTAARIYAEMVAEVSTITTRFNEVPVAAKLKGDRVVAVITRERDNSGRLGPEHRYDGHVIIDATYEGDVAAFAGVPFRIGRESRSKEEPHAGHIYFNNGGCAGIEVLPETILAGSTGRGDNKLQAFTFRFVAKDYGRPDHPYLLKAPPSGYDASLYRWNPDVRPWLPNGKADMLGVGDLAGLSTRYVLADWKERTEIEEIYRNHELGWLYYIQTEGNSPQWGLADDEFTDNNNWPYRLYVRQGRRIEGLYTLTESDIHKDLRGNGLRGPLHRESVAIGGYKMDTHKVQNPTTEQNPFCPDWGEGELHLTDVTGPYQIPYGVMVPQNRKGLLVPVAISCTHVAMSSVRMEPVWSSLGQAAGVAAVLALNSSRELNEVPVTQIQDALLQQRSMLFFYMDMPDDATAFEAIQKLSLWGAVDGNENYYFRPDQPVRMGEFARMAIVGLEIPISISAAHFRDVPRGHPAFKYIETLYDNSTQSTDPFFPFEFQSYMDWGSKPKVAFAYPDQAVTSKLATKIVSRLLKKKVPLPRLDKILTRSEAATLIYRLRSDFEATEIGN